MAKDKYKTFLSKIDELSQVRLERIDVIFQVNRYKFMSEGYELTEVSCIKGKSIIYRNNTGFFAYEENALNTKEEYEAYQQALDFIKKHKDEFKLLHGILQEKEMILDGYYKSEEEKAELNSLVMSLGYGETRKRLLDKYDGEHPSKEFKELKEDLNKLDKTEDKEVIDILVKKAFGHIKKAVNEGFKVELKKMTTKYDTDFDNYVGVAIIDSEAGVINLLYGSDGFEVDQNISSKSINTEYPFLEVYLKIITMGLLKNLNI